LLTTYRFSLPLLKETIEQQGQPLEVSENVSANAYEITTNTLLL